MSENNKHTYCLNCNTPYPEALDNNKEIFCTKCGQSSKDSRLSFTRLIKDAVSNILNLDSRLVHTFRDLIYPSKLTRTYIEGKRKYYVNPARLFIFMLLGLITLSLFSIHVENNQMGVDSMYSRAERSKMLDEYNSMVDTIDIDGHEIMVDSIRAKFFRNVKPVNADTLGKNGPELFNLKPTEEYGIATYDGIHLSHNEIFKKYNVSGFWEKLSVGQYIRLMTDPAGGIKHVVKNMTWAIFITVLLISLLLKLMYIRKPYYLVEHVVLVLNSHSLIFLVIAINIVLTVHADFGKYHDEIGLVLFGCFSIFVFIVQFLSLKKYYNQGIFKTFVKQLIINTAYMMIFNMAVLLVAIISLILF